MYSFNGITQSPDHSMTQSHGPNLTGPPPPAAPSYPSSRGRSHSLPPLLPPHPHARYIPHAADSRQRAAPSPPFPASIESADIQSQSPANSPSPPPLRQKSGPYRRELYSSRPRCPRSGPRSHAPPTSTR